MLDIDKAIYDSNSTICNNIELLRGNERGLLSQNILSQLRNFLECLKSATPFPKCYLHKEKWTFDS